LTPAALEVKEVDEVVDSVVNFKDIHSINPTKVMADLFDGEFRVERDFLKWSPAY
jgi:hypothetical protein